MNDGETGIFNDSVAVESVAVDCSKPVEIDEKLDRQSSAESGIQSNSSEHSNSISQSDEEQEKNDSKENTHKEKDQDENTNTVEQVEPASSQKLDHKDSDTGSESSETPATPTRNDDITASTGSPFKSPRKSSPSKSSDASSKPTRSLLKNPSSPKGTRHIRFACVREYVFPRQQSFCTLPSTGGCALGMDTVHHNQNTLPLPQHRERLHSKRRKKIRHWRRKQRKINSGIANKNASDLSTSSDSDSDAPEEDLAGVDDWWFLQSIPPKKRRKILKRHIPEVDSQDRANNRGLRKTRDVCGCSCNSVCYPDTCECAQNGIPCQVDREGFPCGCAPGRCGNSAGRRSFNSARVRHHFFKTMYRLRCQEQGTEPSLAGPSGGPEVPLDEPQQPFSFGDFTKPSDFHGTIFWPQQWGDAGASNQWTGMQNQVQDSDATSRLCESTPNSTLGNDPLTATSSVEHEISSAVHSSESSTEESESKTESSKEATEPTETERIEHEADITVVNEDESRDSFSRNFESSSSDECENIDPISGSKSDPSDQSETEQDDQNSDQSDEDYPES